MNKKMSPEQIEANRRNAQKSTGPRTPEGQTVSKMNAVKHGILSKQVLVRGLNIKESNRELSALHDRFRQELNPVGPVEEMLVDQIVTTHWRLRRALTAESGEIALSVDQGQWKRRFNLEWFALRLKISDDPVSALEDSAMGVSILERWVRDLRQRVEREGELTEAAIKSAFGERTTYLKEFEKLRLRLSQISNGSDEATRREENKKEALKYIDHELMMLHWRKDSREKREAAEEEARQAAAVLPSMDVLEKILRYETKLERQQYRAMSQLERVQRMRRGEDVPPPMTMEVSERP
ncbi:MAG: hypothetical protein ACLQU4_10470 [Limisphaerales bacterium]